MGSWEAFGVLVLSIRVPECLRTQRNPPWMDRGLGLDTLVDGTVVFWISSLSECWGCWGSCRLPSASYRWGVRPERLWVLRSLSEVRAESGWHRRSPHSTSVLPCARRPLGASGNHPTLVIPKIRGQCQPTPRGGLWEPRRVLLGRPQGLVAFCSCVLWGFSLPWDRWQDVTLGALWAWLCVSGGSPFRRWSLP